MEPRVTRVAAIEKSGEHESLVHDRRNVFQAVHGEIDVAARQRFFELFDEETFAADVRQRDLEPDVAARPNLFDLDDVSGALEPLSNLIGLPHRQRTAPGADSQPVHALGAPSRVRASRTRAAVAARDAGPVRSRCCCTGSAPSRSTHTGLRRCGSPG